jgi:hypothetical protein
MGTANAGKKQRRGEGECEAIEFHRGLLI